MICRAQGEKNVYAQSLHKPSSKAGGKLKGPSRGGKVGLGANRTIDLKNNTKGGKGKDKLGGQKAKVEAPVAKTSSKETG